MDAIPTLCASSASCGVAGLGFAFGQSRPAHSSAAPASTTTPNSAASNSHSRPPRAPPATPSYGPLETPTSTLAGTNRPTSAGWSVQARLPSSGSSGLKRQSSTVLTRSSPSDADRPTSGHVTPALNNRPSSGYAAPVLEPLSSGEPAFRPDHSEFAIDRPSTDRTGFRLSLTNDADSLSGTRPHWLRRLSSRAPSRDGSASTVPTPRPGTPSILSNGSSAPFFSAPVPMNPRNRLVKRSASHRALPDHRHAPTSSPFSTPPSSLAFRRPATSHQRSEQWRLHHLQQDDSESFDRSPAEFQKETPSFAAPSSSVPPTSEFSHGSWRPFFQYRVIKVGRDAAPRSVSGPASTSAADTVRCVRPSLGASPALVPGHRVRKPAAIKPSDSATNNAHSRSPLTAIPPNSNHSTPLDTRPSLSADKPRSSFSLSDLLPTPTPSWKRRRRGSLKQRKGRETAEAGRRVASAPVRTTNPISPTSPRHKSSRGHLGRRAPSSPLPALDRFSAFEIDFAGSTGTRSKPLTPASSHFFGAGSPQFPGLEPLTSNQGLQPRKHRSSRVPSDHDSTAFGSDAEHSRVFSLDGEDMDCRSDTIYDSVRTEASGSSHSGAKSSHNHIETVFQKAATPDLNRLNLAAVQQKLSGVSLADNTMAMDLDEDETQMSTPGRTAMIIDEGDMPTPSNRPSKRRGVLPDALPPVATDSGLSSQPLPSQARDDDQWSFEGDDDGQWASEDLGAPVRRPSARLRPGLPTVAESSASGPSGGRQLQMASRPESFASDIDFGSPNDFARPHTALPPSAADRDGSVSNRRSGGALHLRSQSVPLPPETSGHRFNKASKLDSWVLRGKGDCEEWDGDFDFAEPGPHDSSMSHATTVVEEEGNAPAVIVPRSILDRQASVHGQFGQVKELTLLVEELRRLHEVARVHGLLEGPSMELWKEAEGIIDLATLDDDEGHDPETPNSAAVDFDAFDEDHAAATGAVRKNSITSPALMTIPATEPSPSNSHPSPVSTRGGTPTFGRPRQESIAKAKNVLEHINQHRSARSEAHLDPPSSIAPPNSPSTSRKLFFDTTSLRDLVTRAGVVTRALREIVRRVEHPDDSLDWAQCERPLAAAPNPLFGGLFEKPVPEAHMGQIASPKLGASKA